MSAQLPRGWIRARVQDLASVVQYGSSAKTSEDASGIPVLRMGNIVGGRLTFEVLKYLPTKHEEFPALLLTAGDVLFNRTNSPELVGKTAVYTTEHPTPCSFASYLIRLRFSDYEPALFAAYINSGFGRAWIRSCVTQQVGQANVSGGKLKEFEIPVPPLNEQRRIVAKLEAIQARSRRAREALDAVPPLLEKLRQSILAAAFRGDLTKDWRAKHKDVEPASELLKRIRVERRKKWEEAELAKMKAKGKGPSDDRWKGKYEEPEGVDATGLAELPKGWCWATAEELTDASRSIIYGIIKAGPDFPGGVPYVRVTEVAAGRICLDELPRCNPERAGKFARSVLASGDILVSKDGTIGKVIFVPPELEGGNINQHVLRVAAGYGVDRYFLARMIEAPQCQRWMTGETKGIALQGVNVEDFRRMPIALAPISEQTQVVSAVDSALEARGRVALMTKGAALSVASLERAALAKAFRGELVPQEPNDEPAEAMLARARGANGAPPTAAAGAKKRAPREDRKDA